MPAIIFAMREVKPIADAQQRLKILHDLAMARHINSADKIPLAYVIYRIDKITLVEYLALLPAA